MSDRLNLTWENMEEYTDVPLEYRFVDKVEVIPGKEAFGMKAVSSQDWYFRMHFPQNPVMPGVFLMEAMQQTGLFIITTLPEIKEKLMLFQGCESMRMYQSVRPGDIIDIYVLLKSYRHGIAKYHGEIKLRGTEDRPLVCSMDFTLISKSDLPKVSLTKKILD